MCGVVEVILMVNLLGGMCVCVCLIEVLCE